MKHTIFIRNVQARDQLEIFIVSGVSSLLLLRYFLYLSGYPQVGSGSLHIAHMLYGGLLMMISILLQLSFLGRRLQRFCALLGGIGFGIFIDEIGKFLTRDNNYFFRPAIGIIYGIFVLLYIASTLLTRSRNLTSTEYQANALVQLEEAVLHKMDEREKAAVLALLQRADAHSPITRQLRSLLANVDARQITRPNMFHRWSAAVERYYEHLWQAHSSEMAVRTVFIIITILSLVAIIFPVGNSIDTVHVLLNGKDGYGLIIGQLASTILAGGLAIIGIVQLNVSRLKAFEWFRRSTLVSLLLTEFFVFSRTQFAAMTGFILTLVLLLFINFVLGQEQRLGLKK